MSKESKILDNFYDKINTISDITCSKCKEEEHAYGDEFYFAEDLLRKGWHATPTKAYCPTCNPYKVIRDKK